jgi:hypothetical protein
MKLKRLQFKQILKLHLLKYRTYEQSLKNNNFNLVTELTLNQIIINFKKILQVIFQYHSQNKRILFIGIPKKLELKINKTTNHVAVSKSFNIQGLISNNANVNMQNTKHENRHRLFGFKSLLPKLSKRPDLVVLISHDKKQNILKECFVAKTPIINFETDNESKEIWSIYSHKVQLNNNNSSLIHNKNIFFIGLNFLFKISKTNNKLSKSKPLTSNTKSFQKQSFQK